MIGFEEVKEEEFNSGGRTCEELDITELPTTYEGLMNIAYQVLHKKVNKKYNHLVIDCIKELSNKFEFKLSMEYFRYWGLTEKFDHNMAVQNIFSQYGYFQTRKEHRKLRNILKEFKVPVVKSFGYFKRPSAQAFSKIILPRVINVINISGSSLNQEKDI